MVYLFFSFFYFSSLCLLLVSDLITRSRSSSPMDIYAFSGVCLALAIVSRLVQSGVIKIKLVNHSF